LIFLESDLILIILKSNRFLISPATDAGERVLYYGLGLSQLFVLFSTMILLHEDWHRDVFSRHMYLVIPLISPTFLLDWILPIVYYFCVFVGHFA